MSKRVLVVDDEDYMRETMERCLKRRGHEVYVAATGKEAVVLYKEHQTEVAFLDMKLPDMEGVDIFKKIREINPQAKIYFISGVDDRSLEETTKTLGANGYLTKPIELNDVMAILEGI